MRLFKIFMTIFVVALLYGAYFYFSKSSSYQKSIQAKVYYSLDNYDEAFRLSKLAYAEDNYNKMALTIFTQSKISKSYVDYIAEGKDYLQKISDISGHRKLTVGDTERIKLMCDVMIEKYQFISPTKLTNPALVNEAKNTYEKFEKLYKELF
jgi:hypothetical protein